MIDLNDEKQKYFYLGKCISGQDIDFYNFKIKQPLVGEIFNMGEDDYFKLLKPFLCGRSLYTAPDDMSLFECAMNDREMRPWLLIALRYFIKIDTEDIVVYKSESMSKKLGRRVEWIRFGDKLIFNDEKFNDLQKLILFMCRVREFTKEDFEEEEQNKNWNFVNDEARRKYELFLKEKNKATKSTPKTEKSAKLVNVYDYVVHSQSIIDYQSPLNMTIYQLYNSYNNQHAKENVKFIYEVASNGLMSSKEKLKNLSEVIAK